MAEKEQIADPESSGQDKPVEGTDQNRQDQGQQQKEQEEDKQHIPTSSSSEDGPEPDIQVERKEGESKTENKDKQPTESDQPEQAKQAEKKQEPEQEKGQQKQKGEEQPKEEIFKAKGKGVKIKTVSRAMAKVIRTIRSPKTGAYTYKEEIVPADEVKNYLAAKSQK